MNKKNQEKIVFLDRDGVINKDSPDYIKSWSEFTFLPGSLEAIKTLTQNEFKIIIISNQSIINRKMISVQELDHIFSRMKAAIESEGGRITAIYYCPHVPEDRCLCRKPLPGLIRQAQLTHHIDLSTTVMVGDSAKDIECAKRAGCGKTILVKTGNGAAAEKQLAAAKLFPDVVVRNLLDAADWIINQNTNPQ